MLPRERDYKKKTGGLADNELIALVIGGKDCGKDIFNIANEIEKKFSDDFTRMSYEELMQIDGMKEIYALKLCSACELFRKKKSSAVKITCPNDAVALVEDIRERRQEHFIAITVNGAGYVIQKRTVFIGTLNKSLVHPREIFADAIRDRASSLIIIHNHPSGETDPSREDILVTEKLTEGGRILGIEILDHIIISPSSYFSFKENGKL